jgi:DNA-binding NtrC family response regulator
MGSKNKKDVNILVVDNNRQLTDTIVEMLSRSGYSVTGAYGGMEGVKRFQEGEFQVVVTDLMMPDVDGMDLLKTVKGIDNKVSVVMITGYGTVKKAVEAIKNGAYDFIEKPVDREKLEMTVERALERHSLFRQLGVFRGLTLALTISIPFWLLLGIILAGVWKN